MQRVRELWRLVKSGGHVVSMRNLGLGAGALLVAPLHVGTALADVVVLEGTSLDGPAAILDNVDNSGLIDTTLGDVAIDGNLTFQSGSSLAVLLGGGTSTKVDVTGNAIIMDGANIIVSGDLTQDTAATILATDGIISGAFEKVYDDSGNQLFYAAISTPDNVGLMKVATVGVGEVVLQAATGVMLDAHRGLLNTIHARIDHRYRDSAGKTGVQRLRGEISSAALMSGELDSQYTNLFHSDLDAAVQSDQHTPGFISDLMYSQRSSDEKMRRALSALPRMQISSNYGGMWLEGFGVKSKQSANGNGAGYTAESGGASMGLDSKAAKNWTFGGMIGYGMSNADLAGNAGSADGDTVYTGVYMANISTTHYANLFLTAGVTKFEGERAVTDGITDGIATDEFGAYMWDTRLELGRTFGFSTNSYVRPNLAVEYISAYQDDYSDDGAGLVPGLTVEEHTTRQFRTEGQIDVLFGSDEVNDSGWSGRIYTGIAHEIYLDDMMTEAFLSGFATPIAMSTGDKDHRTFSMYGVSLSWAMNQRLRAHLSYQGEQSSDLKRNNLVAGISVSW